MTRSAKARFFVTRALSVDLVAEAPADVCVDVFPHDRVPSPKEIVRAASGCRALLTSVSDPITSSVLDAMPSVRHIAQVAVGYNNIDVDACRARGVLVTHTPDVLTDATADLTWALLLAVSRRLREGEALLRSGRFKGWSPTMLLGKELSGATLGIFGFGRIGRAVARRAMGFGMRVIYSSRSEAPSEPAESRRVPKAEQVSFERLLRQSDVLSIHAPLDAKTRGRFGADELGEMKEDAILINTARGPIVDEAALGATLERGHLFGAGLDVFENEPRVHPSLLNRDDVVILPHLGSATHAARARMARTAFEDAVRVARGDSPQHPVPELAAD